ncbi:WYL domain-containing protein [Terrisporobacter petrolearius]|uniref:WYL domain-containing protein n=1 Tax=Terrisporobacter petrolearius TaxID=1460447 RepID=UPI0031CC71E0
MGNKQFKFNIEKIKKALNDNKHLSFEYYGVNRKKDKRCVEPYKLIRKENNWYLQGYCTLRENFRVFKPKPLDKSGWIDKRLFTIKLLVDWSLREQI